MEQYEILERLGSGSYGAVYRATVRDTGAEVAIKKMTLDSADEGCPATVLREISSLKHLSAHPNVVALYDVVLVSPREISLVFEFCNMDLKGYMKLHDREHGSAALPPPLVKNLMFQMLRGMAFVHSKRYLHRDLKPQNILIRHSGTNSPPELKIADFGLSRSTTIPVRKFVERVITLWYRPPELLLGDTRYTSAVDVWSIGCIMAEMTTGRAFLPVGRNEQEEAEVHVIVQKFGRPRDDEWTDWQGLKHKDYLLSAPASAGVDLAAALPGLDANGLDLLRRMMRWNPNERITCSDAMRHPYFNDLPPDVRVFDEL